MKAGRTTDPVAYPDLGHQLVDLVSQQPEGAPVKGVAVRRGATDEFRAMVASGLTRLEQLTSRAIPPLSTFGFVSRPDQWDAQPAIFHEPKTSAKLKELSLLLKSNSKLEELAEDLITDSKANSLDVRHLLPADFRGLQLQAGIDGLDTDPEEFVQERSLLSLEELRTKLFGSGQNDGSQTPSALLQFRTKLSQLKRLGEWIDNSFGMLDALDVSRAKGPLLC